MPTDLNQVQTIKSQTLTLIATITASPKPSYSIDGQSVSWTEYLKQLQATVAWCDEQLAREDPFEIHSRGTT
jgi:hypothetical protein